MHILYIIIYTVYARFFVIDDLKWMGHLQYKYRVREGYDCVRSEGFAEAKRQFPIN